MTTQAMKPAEAAARILELDAAAVPGPWKLDLDDGTEIFLGFWTGKFYTPEQADGRGTAWCTYDEDHPRYEPSMRVLEEYRSLAPVVAKELQEVLENPCQIATGFQIDNESLRIQVTDNEQMMEELDQEISDEREKNLELHQQLLDAAEQIEELREANSLVVKELQTKLDEAAQRIIVLETLAYPEAFL